MKILNNYEELIISVDLDDTKKFEKLLAYSDCRNELLTKYIQNFGIEGITRLTNNVKAKALRFTLEKICSECKKSECILNTQNSKSFEKKIYVHQDNIVSNLISHNYTQYL